MDWGHAVFNRIRRGLQRLLGFSTLGVRALVINANQQILLIEHTYTPGWHLPGGGVGPGECPRVAIDREVLEETHVKISNPTFFALYRHNVLGASDYPLLYIVQDFLVDTPFTPNHEIQNIGWFDWQNLPEGTTDSTRARIQEYFNQTPISPTW